MPYCDFSEDEYEDNLLIELRDRYGHMFPHFKPSRTLEENLGYDFAVATSYPVLAAPGIYVDHDDLKALLPVQRRAILHHRYVTTFVQCKVPFFVSRRHPATSDQFDHWGQPFFRVDVPDEQNRCLVALETALAGRGIVRYSAPCFHSAEDSETFCLQGEITQRSHFVSPAPLAGHEAYTYLDPGQQGLAFSKPEPVPVKSLLRSLFTDLSQTQPELLAAHVSGVWRALETARERTEYHYDRESLLRIASRVVGNRGSLPLDPLGVLPREMSGWPDGAEQPSILSFALAIATIERLAREFVGCAARIFFKR